MKTKTSFLLSASLLCLAAISATAAVIPAGTTITVQTLDPVRSTDAPGTKFGARLIEPISVQGKVVLPAGTKLTGKVATSQRMVSHSARLTVNLDHVIIAGHAVAIKTSGAVPMESYTSSRGVSVSRGDYQVASGRTLRFRSAHPIQF